MPSSKRMWARWKAFAQRAAEVQASVVFFVLYYVAIVPMGLMRLGGASGLKRSGQVPSWTPHQTGPTNVDSARRQF